MTTGTTVYLSWYDFAKKTEHVCMGQVVDNSDYDGTQWQDYVNVRFQPPSLSAPICHHFPEDKLSHDASSVPHDDCYLVCGKKTRSFEHDPSAKLRNTEKLNTSDAWQQVQQFKQDHWDYQHGHLDTDALDEYYQMWRDAIAAKRGYSEITSSYQAITGSCPEISTSYRKEPQPKKQKATTNITQLSLFD